LRKQFANFKKETMPVINELKGHNKIKEINALRSIDDVFGDVEHAFKGYV
jgi:adenylate kinase family enzyme